MSDKQYIIGLVTADPTAPPVNSESFGYFALDPNHAVWIRPIATLGAGIGVQTSRVPDSDGIAPAGVIAFDVAAFNYIWDPVNNVWDREQRYQVSDDMPNIEARTVISFGMGYDGVNWDRLRIGAGNADAVTPEALGLLKVLSRLTALNAGNEYDRLRSGADNVDADAAIALGVLKMLARNTGWNGASWDRLYSGADNVDADPAIALGVLKMLARNTGWNGAAWDRVRVYANNVDNLGPVTSGAAVSIAQLYGFDEVGNVFDRIRSAASSADGVLPLTQGLLQIFGVQGLYNPYTNVFDRARANHSLSLFPAAQYVGTASTIDFANVSNRGLHVVIDCTSINGGAPSVVPSIQGRDVISGAYYDILVGNAITAVGTTVLKIYPGIGQIANGAASDILPRVWRFLMTHADAQPIDYSVGGLVEV